MIRATVTSVVDQALLSALSFGIATLLIHFANKEDYGLYSQLVNLQSFFSPFHAGIFVSAYLALASKMDQSRQVAYRGAMAQAELAVTVSSAILVVAICIIGGRLLNSSVTLNVSVSFGCALLGLWWREFVRQTRFVNLRYVHALHIDAGYCVATAAALSACLIKNEMTTAAVFWSMAFGALFTVTLPLFSLIREVAVDPARIRRDMALSWNVGRWDVLGSFVTWGYAQSYIYFAAFHGGLIEAAEVSAGRLLGMPLSLIWYSYSNVLRPSASRLLANESYAAVQALARRSVLVVIGLSLAYAAIIFALIPVLEPSLFSGKFPMLRSFSMWWIAYFTLTGVTTVSGSILRSALQFRKVFDLQVISCVVAVGLLALSMSFAAAEALVVAMVLVELTSAVMFWRSAATAIAKHPSNA